MTIQNPKELLESVPKEDLYGYMLEMMNAIQDKWVIDNAESYAKMIKSPDEKVRQAAEQRGNMLGIKEGNVYTLELQVDNVAKFDMIINFMFGNEEWKKAFFGATINNLGLRSERMVMEDVAAMTDRISQYIRGERQNIINPEELKTVVVGAEAINN